MYAGKRGRMQGKGECWGEKEEIGLGTGRIKGIRGECRKKGKKTGQKEKIVGIR